MTLSHAQLAGAFVALGSNLGDSRRIIEDAFARLQTLSARPLRRSSLWRSAPVSCPPGSPDFINAVAALVPLDGESPESLQAALQSIEREFGRSRRGAPNEPRLLDLDLIAFGAEVRSSARLRLPHPRAHLRAFVLRPLCELAPDLLLPGQALTVAALVAALQPDPACIRL